MKEMVSQYHSGICVRYDSKEEFINAYHMINKDPSQFILNEGIRKSLLWKENNKLFMMAEARLQHVSKKVDEELNGIEKLQLSELGKSRQHYEELAENLTRDVSNSKN